MIFYREGLKATDKKGNPINFDYKARIDSSVFPGHQGGPHNHIIGAAAVAFNLVT